MIPLLLIHPKKDILEEGVLKMLADNNLERQHPNVLWLENTRVGIEDARKLKNHLSLKPYQDGVQTAVILAEEVTPEAQNTLLKIIEEPPGEVLVVIALNQEGRILPTITSRCQTVFLKSLQEDPTQDYNKYFSDIEQLRKQTIQERFVYIEKQKDREVFFLALVHFYQNQLVNSSQDKKILEFNQDLITAQMYLKQNVNIRAILEYLMLKM